MDNRQYTALEWVLDEIVATLKDAEKVLSLYEKNPRDVTQLRFCLTHIHQVYGSLHMIGFHGAALLAEEMEVLTKALLDNSVESGEEAHDVLLRAIQTVPAYLKRVQETKRDYPANLLSLLNDLRAARSASLLSESALFTPNLNYAYRPENSPQPISSNDEQLLPILEKLLQMFQFAAASFFNNVKKEQSLTYLLKVSERLQRIFVGTQRFAVWEIAHALVDGLQQQKIPSSVAIKQLFRDLNNELKTLAQKGSSALLEPTPEKLLNNLLYYLSNSNESTPEIDRLKKIYEIDLLLSMTSQEADQLPSEDPVDGMLIDAVANDVKAEFDSINQLINSNLEQDKAAELQQRLQKIIDNLAILGVGEIIK